MSRDVVGDFLTIIRNGLSAKKRFVQVQGTKLRQNIAQVLKNEGYIKDYAVEALENNKSMLTIHLKYVKGESVIHEIGRVSKPSRRCYQGYRSVEPVIGGLGISILTTSSGLMTDREACKKGVGGEVLCYVW